MRSAAVLAISAAILAGARPAGAQDVSELEAILQDPVVSTPSAVAASASVAPATSTSITAAELREQGIRTLDEAVSYLSLGMETEPNMHGPELGARGVMLNGDYGNHVLLLVDGLALNEPWNGSANFDRGAGIPFELIDHIEVMLGPASVLYGSNAMLGVINIVTKRARDYRGEHVLAEAESAAALGAGYGIRSPFGGGAGLGYRFAGGIGEPFTLLGHDAELTTQLEYYRFHGPEVDFANQVYGVDSVTGEPKRFAPGTGTGVWGGRATKSWFAEAPTGYGRLRIGELTVSWRGGWYKRSAPYEDSLIRYFGDFDPTDDFERDSYADVVAQLDHQLTAGIELSAKAFAQYNRYEWYVSSSAPEDCEEGQTSGCRWDLRGVGQHWGAEVKTSLSWRDPWNMVSLLGATGQVRHVESREVTRSDLGDSLPSGQIDILDTQGAVFVEHTARPATWLDINVGARLDADERFGTAASPRVAFAGNVWEGATLRAIYAEAFRAPSAYELYYADPLSQVDAPDLRPERTRSAEGSFEQRVGPHRFFVGLFRSWWDDMVVLDTLPDAERDAQIAAGTIEPSASSVLQYRNRSRIDSYGVNASVHLVGLQSRLRFDSALTAARATMRTGDDFGYPPVVAPQVFGNARVAYDLGGGWPTIGVAARLLSRRLADRFYDGGFAKAPEVPPAVAVRLTLSGNAGAVAGLSYRAGVQYSFAREAAYVIGPSQYAVDETSVAQLQPMDRLHGFVGLQYDIPR